MKDKSLSPIHPGEVLLEDFMKPLNPVSLSTGYWCYSHSHQSDYPWGTFH
jgi:hypothetical protein